VGLSGDQGKQYIYFINNKKSHIVSDDFSASGARLLVPRGSASTTGTFPALFLLFDPSRDAYFFDTHKIINYHLMMLPLFTFEGHNPGTGKFCTEGTALRSMIPVAFYKLTISHIGRSASTTGAVVRS